MTLLPTQTQPEVLHRLKDKQLLSRKTNTEEALLFGKQTALKWGLTSLRALVEFEHKRGSGLDNVQDGQQGAREAQQLIKAVEAKVDQVTCQVDHLLERQTEEKTLKFKALENESLVFCSELMQPICSALSSGHIT